MRETPYPLRKKDSLAGLSFCECLNRKFIDDSQLKLLYHKGIPVGESLYRSVHISVPLALSSYALFCLALSIFVRICTNTIIRFA